MIKTTCFGPYWPSSGFSSERFVCCKSVHIKHINTLTAYNYFGWKTWWWPMLAEICSSYRLLIKIN